MDYIYFRGFYGRRHWCSDVVKLKPYFQQYSNHLLQINLPNRKTKDEKEIIKEYFPEDDGLSPEEENDVFDVTHVTHLTNLFPRDLITKAIGDEPVSENIGDEEKSEESQDSTDLSQCTSTSSKRVRVKKCKNRIKQEQNGYQKREIPVDSAMKCGKRDLVLRADFMVSFRIHDPFSHHIGDNSRPGRCMQEIAVLGCQTLDYLRDKIICESDFQDIRGDMSNCPDARGTKRARDAYFSGMFYLDNTFYVDFRNKSNEDYSIPIKKWAEQKGIALGETKSMAQMKVEDLEIRFGYPYVYMHQGCCEHLVVISDARLLTPKDSLCSSDYPLMKKVSSHSMVYCMLCSKSPAVWIVKGCARLAHCPTYECKNCFKSFHYINGQKIGNFQAYQYWQKGAIL